MIELNNFYNEDCLDTISKMGELKVDCVITGLRFDAQKLGYSKSVFSGSLKYEGSCFGCYWNGPREFRKSL